jgi:hypothetical protein
MKIKLSTLSLGLSLLISVILIIAIYGKLLYPKEDLKVLDRIVSVFEIVLIVILIAYHNHVYTWLLAASLFACWFGYSLFWYLLKLPCSCMGNLINVPSIFSMVIDAGIVVLSLALAVFLGARKDSVFLSMLVGLMLSLIGYACADWVYLNLVVKM